MNNASQKFWLKVREVFNECGLRISKVDEVFYYHQNEEGNLDGMVSSHVDDFILAGTEKFIEEITLKNKEKLEISKLKDNVFHFTGIDVRRERDEIVKWKKNMFTLPRGKSGTDFIKELTRLIYLFAEKTK